MDKCAACGSTDTQALTRDYQCMACGATTSYETREVELGASQVGLTTTKGT